MRFFPAIFILLLTGTVRAEMVKCTQHAANGDTFSVLLDTKLPSLSKTLVIEQRDGKPIKIGDDDLLSSKKVCGESISFREKCRAETRKMAAQGMSYSFACGSKVKGQVTYSESGVLSFSCQVGNNTEEKFSAQNCSKKN